MPTTTLPLPAGGPADLARVKGKLKISDTQDDDELEGIVAAVNAVVRSLPVADRARGAEVWEASVAEGACMLAARLHRRKNSPAGVETFGAEGAFYVSRNDPDIAMLLGLGAWAAPAVG